MTGWLSTENLDLIARLHGKVQDLFEGRIRLRMHVWDFSEDHPGESAVGVLLLSDTVPAAHTGDNCVAAQEKNSPRAGGSRRSGDVSGPVLVGKPREFQEFLNKEGPDYEEGFMLDLEFNYGSGTCTIHNINLPGRLRGGGFGSAIILEAERLAREMGMQSVYAPSEHRSTSFWLKNGYRFTYEGEEGFFLKNRERPRLYVAYDLRKKFQ